MQRAVDSQSTLTKLHDVCAIERARASAVSSASANSCDSAAMAPVIRTTVRMYEVVPVVRYVLTRGEFSRVAIDSTFFDHSNGEGEIKAFSWLMRQDEKFVRLIMVRDNDVYVYSLATYIHRAITSTMLFADILVFHENTRSIIRCWDDLYARLQNRIWIFILWISICFGNDYATGILEKSLCSHQAHFDYLYNYAVSNKRIRRDISNSVPFILDAPSSEEATASLARVHAFRHDLLVALLELQNAMCLYDIVRGHRRLCRDEKRFSR